MGERLEFDLFNSVRAALRSYGVKGDLAVYVFPNLQKGARMIEDMKMEMKIYVPDRR